CAERFDLACLLQLDLELAAALLGALALGQVDVHADVTAAAVAVRNREDGREQRTDRAVGAPVAKLERSHRLAGRGDPRDRRRESRALLGGKSELRERLALGGRGRRA